MRELLTYLNLGLELDQLIATTSLIAIGDSILNVSLMNRGAPIH